MNIPIGKWSGSDATEKLEKKIVSLSEASEKQTKHIIKLTYAMLLLTLIMTFMVGAQIWIAIQVPPQVKGESKQIKNNPIPVLSQSPSPSQSTLPHLKEENKNLLSPQSKQPGKD